MKNKKAQIFDQLGGLAIGVATMAILLTVAFLVISEGRQQVVDLDPCGTANATINFTDTDNNIIQCCDAGATSVGFCGGANLTFGTSSAYNSTVTLANATQQIPGWIPLIIIAVIGSILLGLVALFRR